MTHAPAQSEVVLQTHNFNMSLPEMATAGVTQLYDFLYDVRASDDKPVYDGGFQITPTRAIMAGVRASDCVEYLGLATKPELGTGEQPLFTSGEQSWSRGVVGGTKYLAKERGSYNGQVQFGGGIIIQEQRASLGGLARLQRLHSEDHKMPVVVYGGQWRTGNVADFKDHEFASVSTQLHPELFQDMWGLDLSDPSVYSQLSTRLRDQHIDGITIDPVHLWRRHDNMPDVRMDTNKIMDTICDQNIPIIDFHVGLARTDRKGEDRDVSLDEMALVLKGAEYFATTRSGALLQAGVEIWQAQNAGNPDAKLRAVIEMPHDGLVKMDLAGSKEHIYATNRVVAHNVRSFLQTTLASAKARNPHPGV